MTVTTNLELGAPEWQMAVRYPDGSLDDAARIIRLLDRSPGLDQEEIAEALGIDHWRSHEICDALCRGGILGLAKEK